MKFNIRKATKAKAKLRMGLQGPAKTGKTYTSLRLLTLMGCECIGLIDSEHESSDKYADEFDFVKIDLDEHSIDTYIEAITALEDYGCDGIAIDSLSHAWMGKGGALEEVDNVGGFGGNKWSAWSKVTPKHQALIDKMLRCKAHLIATMRAKTAWETQTNDKGKKVPVKIGLQAVQRDGMEYEFDMVGELDHSHTMRIEETRCAALEGTWHRPGEEVATILREWLSDGTDYEAKAEQLANDMRESENVQAWAQANLAAIKLLPKRNRDWIKQECRDEQSKRDESSQRGASSAPPTSRSVDAAE